LLSICLYVWFKRSRIDGSEDTLVKHYSQKTRRLALVGLFAVALLMVLSGGGWNRWHNLQKHQIVVLVADFKNLQSEDRGVEESIIDQLGNALAEYDDVKLQALKEEITAQEGSKVARAKGKKHHADIVLWGWYEESKTNIKVTVKFEVLEKLHYLSSVETKPLIQPIAKLDNFEIQAQLSEEMSYLTLFTIGVVRYEAQDYEDAIARFTKALEFVPDAEQAIAQDTDTALHALYLYRGDAYQFQETQHHTTYYNKALGEQMFVVLTDEDTYYNKEKLEQAIADYTQSIKIYPKFAVAYNNRGHAYHHKGELDQAISDYTQALKIYPKYAKVYNNRGLAYSEKGELDQAISDYNQALKIYPEFTGAYNNRGLAYSEKGELDQAISDYNQALKIYPEFTTAYYNRGNGYYKKGELDQAIADYTQSIKIYPKQAEAYNNRGVAYYKKGKLDQAIADYTQTLKINPKFVAAYHNRGVIYSEKGELDQAISDYTQALKINPDNAITYTKRGILYSEKGKLDQAIADFNQALKINPKFALAYTNRGYAYSKLGNKQKATQDLKKAAKLFADQGDTFQQQIVLALLNKLYSDPK
ncbi:MAG: tetratricopeptide repeat protein, partial [Symploca sp. SIO3E6]|nr:tetratricopeptide repeat protein [Caldora sp. SIO3E6]